MRNVSMMIVLASVALAACADELARYPFTFYVQANNTLLEGVPVVVDDVVVGTTNSEGVLRTELSGLPGGALRVTARCPGGHPSEGTFAVSLPIVDGSDHPPTADPSMVTILCPHLDPETISAMAVAEEAMDPARRLEEARACAVNGDNPCVIRLLEGHADSAADLGLLIETYRVRGQMTEALDHMRTYVARFGDTPRARQYGQILAHRAR